ncbi:MAG: 4-(cytidine 5'-diphospho)-2-C-methyl-D-erythritol kinase [Candidatus Omnitrophica bacterium]|nr:4-(cytidine 5'-diphospho)-2-C-methyl-D-erythritol kinase [Candidatus Omnitrophota bacterium]
MRDRLVLKSPAKVNLYLEVIRKRPDGYHDIKTVFEKIALFDIITIRPAERIRITTDHPGLPTGAKNLAYKAASSLFDKAGFKRGAWIDIRKNIPVAAGLGGGSSNAAAVLSGANRFFKLGLEKTDLVKIAGSIGADVPFFLDKHSFAVGSGRGDSLSPLYRYNDINIWHIIVSFGFGIRAKWAYEGLKLGLTPRADDVKIFSYFGPNNDIGQLAASLYNRLEEVVLKRFEVIRAAKALLLEAGAYGAVLSGSGPSVFGITKTRKEAAAVRERIRRKLKEKGSKVFVVETMNTSKGA